MKPSEMLSGSFWAGFITHLSFTAMYQDFLGKELFIQKVNADWMNTSPYMWMVFGIAALWLHNRFKSEVNL